MEVKASLKYEKINRIGQGQGANSEVFLIKDSQLDGTLVAKEIDKDELLSSSQDYFEEAKKIFASRHPNVVPIKYACETENTITLVMPYFSKGSLADFIQENPLSLNEVIRLAQEVLNGLYHIHSKGFLHLDIKPSNIFFTDTNKPMIADFGQSRILGRNGIVEKPIMYIYTIPPEAIPDNGEAGTATISSDIYLMGATLYRAINSDPVFNAQKFPLDTDRNVIEQKIKNGEIPNRDKFMPHVPQKIRKIIKKALHVNPAKRHQSAIELADALANVELPIDWHTQIFDNGEITWQANRGSYKPKLIVELKKDTNNLWNVIVYTDNKGIPIKKRNYCCNGVTYIQAKQHLEEKVFPNLS